MNKTSYSRMATVVCGILIVVWSCAPIARADFAVGKPRNLGATVNTAWGDAGCSTSADGLELYFASNRPGGFGDWDIWVSRRQSTDDPWGLPANLGAPVNSIYVERYPSLSSDGLTLYFSELYPSMGPFRPGSLGAHEFSSDIAAHQAATTRYRRGHKK